MTPNDWSGAPHGQENPISTIIAAAPSATSSASASDVCQTNAPRGEVGESPRADEPHGLEQGSLSGQCLGPYELKGLLGVGGMAEVYRARDLARQRAVAVKVLDSRLAEDATYVAQFRDEARRAARLSHPRIVPLYDVGEGVIGERRVLYIVMPLLRRSLSQRLRRDGALPYLEAIRLALEVAAGLEAAHAAGLIHCDVKPGNILLDAEGHALLCDFGVARENTDAAPPQGAEVAPSVAPVASPATEEWVAGTPAYMAPEQLCGAAVDERADVYSLGVVLYQVLTGQRPFEGDTPLDIATHALRDPVVPPSALLPDRAFPPGLDSVILTALAREPLDRFSSMEEFATTLRRLRDDPVDAWDRWPSTATVFPGTDVAQFQRGRRTPISAAKRLLCVAALAASLACAAGITTMLRSWNGAGVTALGGNGLSLIVPDVEARASLNVASIVKAPRPTAQTPRAGDDAGEMASSPSADAHSQRHSHGHTGQKPPKAHDGAKHDHSGKPAKGKTHDVAGSHANQGNQGNHGNDGNQGN